jgi:hypothetical protein
VLAATKQLEEDFDDLFDSTADSDRRRRREPSFLGSSPRSDGPLARSPASSPSRPIKLSVDTSAAEPPGESRRAAKAESALQLTTLGRAKGAPAVAVDDPEAAGGAGAEDSDDEFDMRRPAPAAREAQNAAPRGLSTFHTVEFG